MLGARQRALVLKGRWLSVEGPIWNFRNRVSDGVNRVKDVNDDGQFLLQANGDSLCASLHEIHAGNDIARISQENPAGGGSLG